MGPKNKLGLSLRRTKNNFQAKIDQSKKNKRILGKKKQAEAELKRKKSFFGPKIGGKFRKKVQKLPNFKEENDSSGQKKTSWG